MPLKAAKGYNSVLYETFTSPASVAANGGKVSGAPNINRALTVTTTSDLIVVADSRLALSNVTKANIHVEGFRTASVSGNGYIVSKYNATDGIQLVLMQYNNLLRIYISAGGGILADTPAASIVVNTEYDIDVVYDGTLAAASRLAVYLNGVSKALSITGTIPTSLGHNSARVSFLGYDTSSQAKVGMSFRSVLIAHKVANSAEEVKDLYENDTIPELNQPLISLPLRSSYIDGSGNRVTENKGTLGGTAKLGDGTTTTTFPTQLSPNGVSFDGGDYIALGNVIKNTNQPWTYVAMGKFMPVVLAGEFLSNYKSAIIPSIIIQRHSTSGLVVYVFSSTGNFKSSGFPLSGVVNGTIIVTNDGSLAAGGIRFYLNGVEQTATSASMGGTLAAATITEGLNIGKDSDNTNYFPAGTLLQAHRLYGSALTATQVRILHSKLIKELNI